MEKIKKALKSIRHNAQWREILRRTRETRPSKIDARATANSRRGGVLPPLLCRCRI